MVIVNTGRFKNEEAKVIDMGVVGNDYRVEFQNGFQAIVFPTDVKKKLATGGSTKTTTTYEELISFDTLKDVNYFIKKYSDGKTISSWLAPLQNYYDKIVMILNAEIAKDPAQKVRDEKKVEFLSEQKQELAEFNDEFHKKQVKNGYATGGHPGSAEEKALLDHISKSSMFTADITDNWEIAKETFSTKKYSNAKELADLAKKEYQGRGFLVKLKKVSFEDLARSEAYFLTAIKPKEKHATGGHAGGIQADDFVKIESGVLKGAKGLVISVNGGRAMVELLEIPKDEKHLRRTIFYGDLSELTKIDDIFSHVKGKRYKILVPVDPENPLGESKEVTGIAGEKEGEQIWVKTDHESFLVFPDELIGNEAVQTHATGGKTHAYMDESHAVAPNIDFVEFKGKNYPIRNIVIKGHGLTVPTEVVIGTLELEAALSKSKYHGKAGAIDGNIYHYVSEDMLMSDEKTLAANLDEKYSIAEPAEYATGGPAKGKRKHQTKKAAKDSTKHFSEPTTFDIRISKALAEKTLKSEPKCAILKDINLMCKEKGTGENWIEVQKTDLVSGKLPSIYKTFEIWIVSDLSKEDCKTELKKLI